MDLMTEMGLLESTDKAGEHTVLRTIATNCCSALTAMTPDSKDVRAVVFELQPRARSRPGPTLAVVMRRAQLSRCASW